MAHLKLKFRHITLEAWSGTLHPLYDSINQSLDIIFFFRCQAKFDWIFLSERRAKLQGLVITHYASQNCYLVSFLTLEGMADMNLGGYHRCHVYSSGWNSFF